MEIHRPSSMPFRLSRSARGGRAGSGAARVDRLLAALGTTTGVAGPERLVLARVVEAFVQAVIERGTPACSSVRYASGSRSVTSGSCTRCSARRSRPAWPTADRIDRASLEQGNQLERGRSSVRQRALITVRRSEARPPSRRRSCVACAPIQLAVVGLVFDLPPADVVHRRVHAARRRRLRV